MQNAGDVGTGVFNVKWLVDGQNVGAAGSHAGVPANSTVLNGNSHFSWVAIAGTHTITFIVGFDNQIPESNEGNNSRSVTVTVTPSQFSLAVSKSGAGSGTVTSSPAGINCGSTCSASFPQGTSVTLTATAASDSTFAGWSGEGCSGTGSCTVSMTQARHVTAVFSTVLSSCVWGFYTNNTSQGWESRLFISNLDTQRGHSYDVFVLATNTVLIKNFALGPSGIAGLTCSDLQACGQAGWLYVQSDAPIFGATLFVINTIFGGGSFTAQPGNCTFSP